jgi:hypothetical protein
VYYYDGLTGAPSVAEADTLIDSLVTKEKTIHSTAVTFVRGRLWTQGATKADSNMISQKNLSGTGSTATVASFDRERAYLFRLRAGNDSRGNPVYLRKWYHSCGNFTAASPPAAGQLDQTIGWPQSARDALVAALPTIGTIGSGTTLGTLCAKSGRLSTAGSLWTAHQFLEHHQMGDMWRAS